MRAVLAVLGILLSTPALLFFWIGTQTFIRLRERVLANVLTLATGLLLGLSVALIFNPAVQRVQIILLAATIVMLAETFMFAKVGSWRKHTAGGERP
jgi:hypothetical protein